MKIPELPSIKVVSQRRLKNIWKKISSKPFPEIYAFTLDDGDFLFLLELLQKNQGAEDSRVKEYGVDFDDRFIEACSFVFEGYFMVYVKQSASLDVCLEHELKHILSDE